MPKKVYKTSIKYHCPFCDEKYPRMELIDHVEKEHSALIPENYTATRVVYEAINKTDHGTCMICKKNVYSWNEKISRYNNLCDNPKCREEVRRIALERHMRVYNKPTLLNDPMQQEKMLSNRHISGKYKYSDGTIFTYTGKYEKATIEFMDKVLNIDSKDIQMPGPVLDYDFNGETHSWITDIYYIPANLIIEVKDGGNNPNKREMPVYRGKQLAKEVMITNLGKFNYLRLTNNNFAQLLEALAEIKYENLDQKTATHVSFFINESTKLELLHEEKSELDDDFKPKKRINLSSLKKIRITDSVIEKYKKEYPALKHVRCRDTSEYKCDGYLWFDTQNELVCHVGSCEYLDDGTKWIVSLEVLPKFKGHDLSKQILDFAVKSMNCKYLSVNKNNKVAKYIYDQYGFKTYQDDDNMDYMTIDRNVKKPVSEGFLFNREDLYYNKDKFDSGEINLCFITGHSGSGKSTMGRSMQDSGIEHYELDDLQLVKDHFTMENLKEYGDLIYSYFKGPGKEFYVDSEWIKENNPDQSEYEDKLFPGFVHYTMQYAKSHKDRKFVLEGVWLLNKDWFDPSEFKNYAFYIKGTSMIVSKLRGSKRDAKNEYGTDTINRAIYFAKHMFLLNWTWYIKDESSINYFYRYFSKLQDKYPVKEEVNTIPSMGRYSTFIIPYTVKNAFDIAIGNDKNNEVLVRGDDDTFKTVGLEKFEELYQPSQILVYNESDACEKFEKMKSCNSISESLKILLGHEIKVFDELMLCENLKLRDFTSEDLGMEMIRRGVVRENEILSGAVKVYDTPTAIKPHVILSKTADGGCFIHTPKNYYLSSDIYPTPEDIPQNVIDTMEDLYVSNAGMEEME